jgi:SAM-dependent methyltransferase
MTDPTQRFSSRVKNYVKYRPTYPRAVIDLLTSECGLTPASIIADLGSGTGLLAQLFLANGNRVLGIEPNQEMRAAGERLLAHDPNFISVEGMAEATTLPDACVDIVTAGQAFHWFDIPATRAECRRILKPGGWVALVWNSRVTEATPFLRAYEALLKQHSDDYARVNHQDTVTDAGINAFFGPGWRKATFDNAQVFDFDGLKGRLLSSSYAPDAGHPNHEPMLRDLRAIFDAHQRDGAVSFLYKTEVYYGRL